MMDKQKVVDMFDECYRTYFITENEEWSLCGECPFNDEIMTGRGTNKN